MLSRFVALSCLVACVACATGQVVRRNVPQQAPLTGADKAAAAQQQAKLHYVEIGPSLKGDYKFGYDTGSGPAGQSFREETRLDDGTVKGAYGYVDANGKQRIVKYTAGKAGFVVESDAAAPGQQDAAAGAAPRQEPRPEPQQPLVPATLPQQQQQPSFDDQPAPVQINRQPAVSQVSAEQQHAAQLRQHQLAQQRALAEQQQLAQQHQQLQQQQLLQQQQQQQQQQQANFAPPQQQPHLTAPQFQQQQHFPTAQSAAHQFADPQTGHFFSSSNDQNINQLLMNQLRALQAPAAQQQQQPQQFAQAQQFAAQAQPAFRQAAFGALPPQQPLQAPAQPLDFSHQLRARQVAQQQPQPQPQHLHQHLHQHQHQQQPAPLASPQSALLALHQQQQHDAQLLAQLRAQQLAQQQQQQQQRAAIPQQVAPVEARAAASQQQRQFLPQPQQQQQQQQPSSVVAAPAQQAAAQLQQQPAAEVFGPPVIDIRTLNYSIGQQSRVN